MKILNMKTEVMKVKTLLVVLIALGKAYEINSVRASLDPPQVSSIVSLQLQVSPMSVIPKKGSFSFTFPTEYPLYGNAQTDFNSTNETQQFVLPSTNCILQQPPAILSATCSLTVVDNRVHLNVTNLSGPLTRFFQLRIPNYISQRSTTLSSTFQFVSLDDQGNTLDAQNDQIYVQPTLLNGINEITLKSSSQVVAASNQHLNVTFVTLSDLKAGDQLRLQLPKWNQKSFTPVSMLDFSQTPSCKGFDGIRPSVYCSFSLMPDYDLVIIPNAIANDTKVGSTLTFSVGPFRNPISTSVFDGFFVQTFDSFGGAIASGSATLQITKYATIKEAALNQNDTTINSQSSFLLSFTMPVPIDEGCTLVIQIPSSLSFGTQLDSVQLSGMFGNKKAFPFTIDAAKRQIRVENACIRWQENTAQAQITISLLTNPAYVSKTDSFEVQVFDFNEFKIATCSSNLFVVTTPGSIQILSASVSNQQVSATADFYLSISPMDYLSENARIVIQFPNQDIQVRPHCSVSSFNKYSNNIMALCTSNKTENSFLIKNFLSVGYNDNFREPINIGISNITMPDSSRPTGNYTISFYDYYVGGFKLIDTVTVTNLVSALPGDVSAQIVTAQSNLTYTNTTLTFQFRANHAILQGGYITVTLPYQITVLPDAACVYLFDANATCVFDGSNTFNVTNAFQRSGFANQTITFSVSQIRSPRSLQQAGNFQFQTKDANGYEIDASKNYRMFPPTDFNFINFTQLNQSNVVVGAESDVTISLQSPLPIYDDDIILVTMPGSQQSKRLSFTFQSCQGLLKLTKNLDCNLQALDSLQILVSSQNRVITTGTTFSFTLSMVANPETTEPSDPFLVQIFDQNNFLLTQTSSASNNLRLEATQPSDLIFAEMSNDIKIAKRPSNFLFQIITNQGLPANSSLIVAVPSQLEVSQTLVCWISTHTLKSWPCVFDGLNQITFSNFNPTDLTGGSTLQFEIQTLVNSDVAEPTDSFVITTQTQQGFLIDRVKSGLKAQSDCNYPCKQCSTNDATQCRNCNTESFEPLNLYFEGSCLDTCPDKYFKFGNICSQCDDDCLLCNGTNKGCTKCHTGHFLLGSTCLTNCPDTHYEDITQRLCVPCEMPCSTCSTSTQTCTSCFQENTSLVHFFRYKCFESCPSLISVFQDYSCRECTDGCQTCEGATDSCRSCANPRQYLNLENNKCIDKCPSNVTVSTFTKGATQQLTCELCDSSCLTCDSINKKMCTRCKHGLKFDKDSLKCLLDCPAKQTSLYIPLTNDIVCIDCPAGCSQCDYVNENSHCTACDTGKVMYNFTCIDYCPKYYTPDAASVCVAAHQLCDLGYFWLENKCQLSVSECKAGYLLNENDTKCIPIPGFHMPFVFILAAIAWTIAVLRKGKQTPHSKIVIINQLLIGYILVQFIGCCIMFILSYQLGYSFITGMHLAVMISHCALNVSGWITTQKTFKKDLAFTHWSADGNQKTVTGVTIASALVSFKMARFYTSELFERKFFSCEISDKFRLYTRPLFVITMVGMIINVLPLLYVSVYTIWLIPVFGYEIRTLSIETLVISLTIAALEIYEYIFYLSFEKKHPRISDLRLMSKTKKDVQILVMEGFEGEASYDNMVKPTQTSHVELLKGLNKQLDEKRKLVDLIKDSEPDTLADCIITQSKKKQIIERRQKFEQQETGMPSRFNNVPDIEMKTQVVLEKIENSDRFQAEDACLLKNMEKLGFLRNNEALSFSKSITRREKSNSIKSVGNRAGTDRHGVTNFEKYETRSEEECKRDNIEFARHFKDQHERLLARQKKKKILHQSFDDEYMREIYDNFGVCSDFESQLSHFSWPPPNFDQVYDNPRLMAQVDFLGEKIKSKFKYCNIGSTVVPSKNNIAQLVSQTRRTQTVKEMLADPFESDRESLESKPEINADFCLEILQEVYDGLSDSLQPQSVKSRQNSVLVNHLRRASIRSESSNFDFSKQNVEAKISLFNKEPLIDLIDSSGMASVSNPEVSKLEINKEESEASLTSEEGMAFDYPNNLEQEAQLRGLLPSQFSSVRAHPESYQGQTQAALTKKEDSTSGLNDETKDGNFSSALDDPAAQNHIINQWDSETSVKPKQQKQTFSKSLVPQDNQNVNRRDKSVDEFFQASINIQARQPFMKLGVESLPFTSRKTRLKEQQMLNDQNRSNGVDRIKGIESLYLGRSANQSALIRPTIANTTDEYFMAHQRHTASALRRMNPKGLRKQNFVEDGQQIMGSRGEQVVSGAWPQSQITVAKLKKNLSPRRYESVQRTADSEAKEFKQNRGFANEVREMLEHGRRSQLTDHHP